MKKLWRFSVSGQGSEGNVFDATGVTPPCELHEAFDVIMKDAFHQLTQGKAVFGHPGVGCKGPYRIRRFYFEEVDP